MSHVLTVGKWTQQLLAPLAAFASGLRRMHQTHSDSQAAIARHPAVCPFTFGPLQITCVPRQFIEQQETKHQ